MFAQLLRKFDPSPNRGTTVEGTNDGSFAPKGTQTTPHVQGGSGSPTKWKTYDLYKRLSGKDGGFTYQPVTGQEAKDGFALSTYPQRSWAKDASEFKLTDLVAYAARNHDLFARKNHFLGAWHDPETGRIYLDVSVVTRDQKKAERLAKKYDQIAYFDLGAGKSVTVNRDATSGGVAKEQDDEPEATDAARAAWIEDFLAGGVGEDVQADDGARSLAGGDRGGAEADGEELGFAHVFKFDPDQPRAPKGDPDGGKWISTAARAGNPATTLLAQAKVYTPEEAKTEGERILLAALLPNERAQYQRHLGEIERALSEGKTSKNANLKAGGGYTKERLALHNALIDDMISRAKTFAKPLRGTAPTVIVLGGRGGSGKSSFGTYVKGGHALGVYNENKYLKLDTDEFKTLLAQHDKLALTDSHGQQTVGWRAAMYHDESGDVFDKAVVRARNAGLNVVLDITLNSPHTNRVSAFKQAGYRVEGYYMHLPPRDAAERAVHRARDGGNMSGRLVPPALVLSSGRNERSFETLMPKFDKWAVYTNAVPRGTPPQMVAHGARKKGEEGFAHVFKAGTSEGAYKAWETIKAKYPEKFQKALAAKLLKCKVSDLVKDIQDYKVVGYRNTANKGYVSLDYLKEHAKIEGAHSVTLGGTIKPDQGAVIADLNKPVVSLTPKQLDLIPGGKQIAYSKISRGDPMYGVLDRHSQELWDSASPSVRGAVLRYTGSGYKEINKASVQGQPDSNNYGPRLDTLMSYSTIPINMSVHRAMAVSNLMDSFPDLKGMRFMSNENHAHNLNLMKSLVGRTYREKAFASTSLQDSYHMSYSGAADDSGRIGLKINVSKGSAGFFIGDRGSHPGEEEVLLPRNSQFFIRGYHKRILEVDLLPEAK